MMIDAFGVDRRDLVGKAHSPLLQPEDRTALLVGGGLAAGVGINEAMRRRRNRKTGKNVTRRQQYGTILNASGRQAWTEPVGKGIGGLEGFGGLEGIDDATKVWHAHQGGIPRGLKRRMSLWSDPRNPVKLTKPVNMVKRPVGKAPPPPWAAGPGWQPRKGWAGPGGVEPVGKADNRRRNREMAGAAGAVGVGAGGYLGGTEAGMAIARHRKEPIYGHHPNRGGRSAPLRTAKLVRATARGGAAGGVLGLGSGVIAGGATGRALARQHQDAKALRAQR